VTGPECPSWCDNPRQHTIHSRTLIAGRGLSVGLVLGPSGETHIGLTAGGASVAVSRSEALTVASALRKALQLAEHPEAATCTCPVPVGRPRAIVINHGCPDHGDLEAGGRS